MPGPFAWNECSCRASSSAFFVSLDFQYTAPNWSRVKMSNILGLAFAWDKIGVSSSSKRSQINRICSECLFWKSAARVPFGGMPSTGSADASHSDSLNLFPTGPNVVVN